MRILSLSAFFILFVEYRAFAQTNNSNEIVTLDFFGRQTDFITDESFNKFQLNNMTVDEFNRGYDYYKSCKYSKLIHQFKSVKRNLNLDDLGLVILVSKYTNEIFKNEDANNMNLFNWFLLDKMGYFVVLCYNSDSVFLMENYNVRFANTIGISHTNTQCINSQVGNINKPFYSYIYPKNLLRKKQLKVNFNKFPKFGQDTINKIFSFQYLDKKSYFYTYKVHAVLNKSIVEYYESIPDMPPGRFCFGYGFSKTLKNSLLSDLKKILENKSIEESLNILLDFVQSLPYEIRLINDPLPEAMFYKDGDCNSKSYLYAYLVRELLKLKTVFRVTEEHINVGVNAETLTKKYPFFIYKSKKYIECEPTWTGFRAGCCSSLTNDSTEIYQCW